MNRSVELVERIRLTTAKRSDYATAKALGLSQSNLREVLKGKRGLGTESIVRASEILNAPLDQLLAEVEADRARTPEKKAFWAQRCPRLLPAVMVCGLSAGVTHVTLVVRHLIHYAQYLRLLRMIRIFPRGLVELQV